MDKLLKEAARNSDEAEVYVRTTKVTPIEFENGRCKSIRLVNLLEIGLRVIKNGQLGFSYATSLEYRSEMVKEALRTAEYGIKAHFNFALPSPLERILNHDPAVEGIKIDKLIQDTAKIIDWFRDKNIEAPVSVRTQVSTTSVTILNSLGLDAQFRTTGVNSLCYLILEGSGVGPIVYDENSSYRLLGEDRLNEVHQYYLKCQRQTSVPTKPMKVIFTQPSMHTIIWRIASGVSGQSLIDKITPLEKRVGEKIADHRLTLIDNSHMKGHPSARPFDDEGVPTKVLPIIENGVFKNFLYDLKTAAVVGTKSTGHGYKSGMWGGDVTTPVSPYPCHPVFEPGDVSYEEMICRVDEGILLQLPNGAHSGNIPAGDFSVNVGLGYYIKDGVILGRVEDAMISGNIYDLLNNLNCVSRDFDCHGMPWLLFDNVNVAGRQG